MGDRQQLQAGLAAYLAAVQADVTWRTAAEHAATIMRELLDPFVLDSPVYRELAAVRAAAAREREGFETQIAGLQRQLGNQLEAVA